MTVTVLPSVALLERAVGYTRGTLGGVTSAGLSRPTPCDGWDLRRLLTHMEDALAAFTEAGAGHVRLEAAPPPDASAADPATELVHRIRRRACALLAAWAEPPSHATVSVGDQPLATELLVRAGALEITLHGWDVGRATGRDAPVPEDLARRLLPVARTLIGPGDRPDRFGPVTAIARVTRADYASGAPSYAARLLAYSGRHP